MDFSRNGANKIPLKVIKSGNTVQQSHTKQQAPSDRFDKEETIINKTPVHVAKVASPFKPDPTKNYYAPPSTPVTDSQSQILKKARSVNIKQLIKQDIDSIKDQLRCYIDIFDAIPTVTAWGPEDAIDAIYQFIRAINYDAVSILLLDNANPAHFTQMLSRGYKNPPGDEIPQLWSSCILKDSYTINWFKLMEIAESTNTVLSAWILQEKISKIGYVPINDGERIMGIILTASYGEEECSPLASSLLELCGSRLGLMITVALSKKALSQNYSVPMTESNPSIFAIEKNFSQINEYIDLLTKPDSLSIKDIAILAKECQKTLQSAEMILKSAKDGKCDSV